MARYLRPLAIAVVILEVVAAIVTVPQIGIGTFHIYNAFLANPLTAQTLLTTGILLTFAMGMLAFVVTAQGGHRRWAIAILILLILFAYSPLLQIWVMVSRTPIYDPETFTVNQTAITFVQLSNHIVPSIVLAVVVFIYTLRRGQTRAG